jgi:hypothetical protein
LSFHSSAYPGTDLYYRCLTSNLLDNIVERACGTDLRSYAQATPIDAEVGDWWQDKDGNYIGCADIYFTARDAAKFGLLYLNDGEREGNQIVSAD